MRIFVAVLSETLVHMQLVCSPVAEQLQYLICFYLLLFWQAYVYHSKPSTSLKPTTILFSQMIDSDFYPIVIHGLFFTNNSLNGAVSSDKLGINFLTVYQPQESLNIILVFSFRHFQFAFDLVFIWLYTIYC